MVIDARSVLKPDAAAIYTELHNNEIDLCFVSETWLNSKVASGLICPNGYLSYRKERSLRFVNRWGSCYNLQKRLEDQTPGSTK